MGRAKEEMLQLESKWLDKCQKENIRCLVCCSFPPYSEKEIHDETGMCSRCAHNAAKDD